MYCMCNITYHQPCSQRQLPDRGKVPHSTDAAVPHTSSHETKSSTQRNVHNLCITSKMTPEMRTPLNNQYAILRLRVYCQKLGFCPNN